MFGLFKRPVSQPSPKPAAGVQRPSAGSPPDSKGARKPVQTPARRAAPISSKSSGQQAASSSGRNQENAGVDAKRIVPAGQFDAAESPQAVVSDAVSRIWDDGADLLSSGVLRSDEPNEDFSFAHEDVSVRRGANDEGSSLDVGRSASGSPIGTSSPLRQEKPGLDVPIEVALSWDDRLDGMALPGQDDEFIYENLGKDLDSIRFIDLYLGSAGAWLAGIPGTTDPIRAPEYLDAELAELRRLCEASLGKNGLERVCHQTVWSNVSSKPFGVFDG